MLLLVSGSMIVGASLTGPLTFAQNVTSPVTNPSVSNAMNRLPGLSLSNFTSNQSLSRVNTTSNFSIFNYPIYGLMIQYPSDWVKTRQIDWGEGQFTVRFQPVLQTNFAQRVPYSFVIPTSDPAPAAIQVNISNTTDTTSLQKLVAHILHGIGDRNVSELAPTTLSGLPAIESIYSVSDKGPNGTMQRIHTDIYGRVGNHLYSVSYIATPSLYLNYLPLAHQIIGLMKIGNFTK